MRRCAHRHPHVDSDVAGRGVGRSGPRFTRRNSAGRRAPRCHRWFRARGRPGTACADRQLWHVGLHLQVMAIENDANRRIGMVLRAPEAVRRTAAPAAAQHRSNVPAYVLGGFSAIGAASFAFFASSGHSDFRRLDQCKPYCEAADVNSVRAKYLVADISMGVSLLALAGAGYWLLSAPREAPIAPIAKEQPLSAARAQGSRPELK